MSDTYEPMRGPNVHNLVLAIGFDDLPEQADMLAIIDWLMDEHDADLPE